MFTPDGLAWGARALAAGLAGSSLVVTDGSSKAVAMVEAIEVIDDIVILRASFGEAEGNFEWKQRSVVLQDGTEVDRLVEDQGRKAPGSIWTAEARIALEG